MRHLTLNPALAFGEAYMDGALEPAGCSLYELFDLVMLNGDGMKHPVLRWHETIRKLTRIISGRFHEFQPVYKTAAWRVALILIAGCTASSSTATSNTPAPTFGKGAALEEAQIAKKRHIATEDLKISRVCPCLTWVASRALWR